MKSILKIIIFTSVLVTIFLPETLLYKRCELNVEEEHQTSYALNLLERKCPEGYSIDYRNRKRDSSLFEYLISISELSDEYKDVPLDFDFLLLGKYLLINLIFMTPSLFLIRFIKKNKVKRFKRGNNVLFFIITTFTVLALSFLSILDSVKSFCISAPCPQPATPFNGKFYDLVSEMYPSILSFIPAITIGILLASLIIYRKSVTFTQEEKTLRLEKKKLFKKRVGKVIAWILSIMMLLHVINIIYLGLEKKEKNKLLIQFDEIEVLHKEVSFKNCYDSVSTETTLFYYFQDGDINRIVANRTASCSYIPGVDLSSGTLLTNSEKIFFQIKVHPDLNNPKLLSYRGEEYQVEKIETSVNFDSLLSSASKYLIGIEDSLQNDVKESYKVALIDKCLGLESEQKRQDCLALGSVFFVDYEFCEYSSDSLRCGNLYQGKKSIVLEEINKEEIKKSDQENRRRATEEKDLSYCYDIVDDNIRFDCFEYLPNEVFIDIFSDLNDDGELRPLEEILKNIEDTRKVCSDFDSHLCYVLGREKVLTPYECTVNSNQKNYSISTCIPISVILYSTTGDICNDVKDNAAQNSCYHDLYRFEEMNIDISLGEPYTNSEIRDEYIDKTTSLLDDSFYKKEIINDSPSMGIYEILESENNNIENLRGTKTEDLTPRVMYWSGKVNQYVDLEFREWRSDPDGSSGASIDLLDYCREKYLDLNIVDIKEYKMESINTWRDSGNVNSYSGTKQSYECVLYKN